MLSLTKTVPFVQRSTQKQYFAFANQTKFQSKQNIRTHINEITNVIRIAYNPRIQQRLMATIRGQSMAKPQKFKPYFGHSGEITDAYIPPSYHKPWSIQGITVTTDSLIPIGLKEIFYHIKSFVRNVNAWNTFRSEARKQNSKYTNGLFAAEATEMYKKIHIGIAEGHGDVVRSFVTEKFFSQLKHLITAASKQSGKVSYDVQVNKAKVVSMRAMQVPIPDVLFGQILVRFDTVQKLQITKDGAVIKSSEPTSITEYCVFERNVKSATSPWKMIGKVTPADIANGSSDVKMI